MNSRIYHLTGKWVYAIAILTIGLIHIITNGFPKGLVPVPADLPGKNILAFITGGVLVVAALMLLIKKYTTYGAYVALAIWLLILGLVHLPKLLPDIHNGGEWTGTFEVIAFISGASMLGSHKLPLIGKYLFALCLFVFGIQHWLYAQYIATLIPTWIPQPLFWSYFVMVVFLAVALSILIQKLTNLAGLLLSLMFILWVLILHLPRAITKSTEPEYTSLFVALAMGGMALLIAAMPNKKPFQKIDKSTDQGNSKNGYLSVFFD